MVKEYILPLGASVSSLVYALPETLDGIVEIGMTGAVIFSKTFVK